MPQTREHVAVLAALGVDDGRRRDHEGRPRPTRARPRRRRPSCCRGRRSCRVGAHGRGRRRAVAAALERVAARLPRRAARRAAGAARLHVDRVVHAARHRHRRDGHAVVGQRSRRATTLDAAARAARASGCGRCRCTTSRSSAPTPGSAWRSTWPGRLARGRRAATSLAGAGASLRRRYVIDAALDLRDARPTARGCSASRHARGAGAARGAGRRPLAAAARAAADRRAGDRLVVR